MWGILLVTLLCVATHSLAEEVCCPRIGCFDNQKGDPMGHLPDPQCPDDIGLIFLLFTRETNGNPLEISEDNIPAAYDPSKLTIWTSHGWMGQADMDWMNELVNKLLEKFDANVMVADWKKGSSKVYYPKAAANTQTVGAEVGHFMTSLVQNRGDDFNNMWCIGFSLGAHVCGHAGMSVNGQLKRVTGLDPAGPSFHKRDVMNGINPTSGQFVDIIHSDGDGIVSYYGLIEPRAHADFYPNGGRDQPGCYFGRKKRDAQQMNDEMNCIDFDGWVDPDSCPYNIFIGCDHYRGIYYFLDTLDYADCHIARHVCTDTDKMPTNCVDTAPTVMGAYADSTKRGLFYLETGKSKPYCRY